MTAHRAAIEKEIAQLYLPKTYTPTKSQEHKDYEKLANYLGSIMNNPESYGLSSNVRFTTQ